MASPGASEYLPPLGDCLDGTRQLVSWQDTFLSLRDQRFLEENGVVHKFLTDTQTASYFERLDRIFPPGSPECKAAIDRLTSAINAPTSANGSYDVKQVKEDALWLSKEADIDQVAALRLVVIELQQQPADCILRDVDTTENDSTGLSFQKSSLLQSVLGNRRPEPLGDAYSTTSARHVRLLGLLVSEQQCAVKCRELVAYSFLSKSSPGEAWLRELGRTTVASWVTGPGRNFDQAFLQLLEHISKKLDYLRSGFPWLRSDDLPNPRLAASWSEGGGNEIVHDLSLILHLIQNRDEAMSASVLSAWFDFMDGTAFFSQIDAMDLSFTPLQTQAVQSLVSLISAAVLQPSLSVAALPDLAIEGPTNTPTSGSYLRDPPCIDHLTTTMMKATDSTPLPAGPAMLTWSIILFRLHHIAKAASESRESRSAQRAIENTPTVDSDTESLDSFGLSGLDRRRSSLSSDGGQPSTLAEAVWDAAQRLAGDDDISDVLFQTSVKVLAAFDVIAQVATDFCKPHGTAFGGLFGVESRLVLFDVLKTANAQLRYDQDLVTAMIAVLSGGQTPEVQRNLCEQFPGVYPAKLFMADDDCLAQFLQIAKSRFPKEYAPFLSFCQCLAPVIGEQETVLILDYLRELNTITTRLEDHSATWDLPSDNDDGNIQLTSDLEVIPNVLDINATDAHAINRRLLGQQAQTLAPYLISSGTYGQALSNNKPLIVMWNYNYSALGFVGTTLQLAAELWTSEQSGRVHAAHADTVQESLSLVTALLESCGETEALEVLGEFSQNFGDNTDIIQIVFDIFENLLYRRAIDQTLSTTLVACVDLVRQLVRVVPDRVWPFMGRSGLLGIDKTESRLRVILASYEIPTGQFAFLLGTVRLYEALIEDSVTNCLKRKAPSRVVARFQAPVPSTNGIGITETVERRILGQFQALLVDVFESSQNWRFQKIYEKTQVTSTLLTTMSRVLDYYHDVDESTDPAHKIVGFLAPAAQHIANSFLANNQNNPACHTLFQFLNDAPETPIGSFSTATARAWLEQSGFALQFASRLVRLRASQGQAPGVLEAGLLKVVPTLVKAYVLHPHFNTPVVELLRDLVVAASHLESPPSILAHLSNEAAKNFLKVLRTLGRPLQQQMLASDIWRFMSAVVSLQQRWLSIVLLTGSTPRDALKDKSDDQSYQPTGSILSLAMNEASQISTLHPTYAASLLDFLAQASDFWPWVADKLKKDKATWDALLAYLVAFQAPEARGSPLANPHQVQTAAHILSIAAVLIHQDSGAENTFAKNLIDKCPNLFEKGISGPAYNSTLHELLDRNFKQRYGKTGCQLSSFKRAARTTTTQIGPNFYYDMDMANKLLSFDQAWSRVNVDGFQDEFARANLNLSLVETQIKLFQSWKSLCSEITSTLVNDEKFREQMLRVAAVCLEENGQNVLPEVIFQRLRESRAELAFTILQFVIPRTKRSQQTEQLLGHAWNLVREHSTELGLALVSESAEYFRTCMRILYLTLQPHTQPVPHHTSRARYSGRTDAPVGVDVYMLEILKHVVARGFQSLVTLLHDDATQVQPADFALLQAMLHTMLLSPELQRHFEALQNIFSDARTPMYAATLFSWADRVLVDGDPIYGEVSINLLLELSTIPPLAEAIITSGSLGQVATSNLARVYQKGVGPFDRPSRLYSIWTKGLLPLAVNLLVAVGPIIGGDTAAFINQFAGQLSKANTSMDSATSQGKGIGAGLMTLSMAGEANMLAMISSYVLAYKDAGASAALVAADIPDLEWDRTQVKRDIEDRLSRRAALRDSLVPTDEREESWLRQKPTDASLNAENLLEHKIVELLTGALEMLGPAEF